MSTKDENLENSTRISKKALKRLQIAAASKLSCELCGTKKFTSLGMYDDHMASKKHRKRKRREETAGLWQCQACDLQMSSETDWVRHLIGRRHHDKLKEWGLQLFSTSRPITQQEVDLLDDSHVEEIEDVNEDE